MRNQIWKSSFLSVAGLAAVASGGSVGRIGQEPIADVLKQKPVLPRNDSTHALPVLKTAPNPVSGLARQKSPVVPGAFRLATSIGSIEAISRAEQAASLPATNTNMGPAAPAYQPAYARQLAVPSQAFAPAPAFGRADQRNDNGMLYGPDTAYVEQISTAQARQNFEQLGLGSRTGGQTAQSEPEFSRVERPATPDYVEVIDDPQAAGKVIIRPMAPVEASALHARPSDEVADKNNDKSPVDHPPQTGGSAEFE